MGPQLANQIKNGAVGVLPTDTIYGLVASALVPEAVEKVYKLKGRRFNKPCIILVADAAALPQFGIESSDIKNAEKYWPGPVSLILPLANAEQQKYQYLHRGQNSLAFRQPLPEKLREFLKLTGPLIAPSANPEGSDPAKTIKEAEAYFGKKLDFYIDSGELTNPPSKLISLLDAEPKVIRS